MANYIEYKLPFHLDDNGNHRKIFLNYDYPVDYLLSVEKTSNQQEAFSEFFDKIQDPDPEKFFSSRNWTEDEREYIKDYFVGYFYPNREYYFNYTCPHCGNQQEEKATLKESLEIRDTESVFCKKENHTKLIIQLDEFLSAEKQLKFESNGVDNITVSPLDGDTLEKTEVIAAQIRVLEDKKQSLLSQAKNLRDTTEIVSLEHEILKGVLEIEDIEKSKTLGFDDITLYSMFIKKGLNTVESNKLMALVNERKDLMKHGFANEFLKPITCNSCKEGGHGHIRFQLPPALHDVLVR